MLCARPARFFYAVAEKHIENKSRKMKLSFFLFVFDPFQIANDVKLQLKNCTTADRPLCVGLGSHISLADSLANGGAPAGANKFTALQQHIDDLTREKFELARGLAEQQKMAASLAEENLLVTEDFNRQVCTGSVSRACTTAHLSCATSCHPRSLLWTGFS